MERLWAPWRMQYIETSDKKSQGCIFCDKPKDKDFESLIVLREDNAFIMLNAFPYNNGHLLIAPYKHTAKLEDLSHEESLGLMILVTQGIKLLTTICHPHGFNVGLNLGRVAGAGVADHLHFHIVPRWDGDTNFMPVLADTKVLPEALEDVWKKLQEAIAQEK